MIAPIGYCNKTDGAEKKYIAPKEGQTNILRWAFNQIAEGIFNSVQFLILQK